MREIRCPSDCGYLTLAREHPPAVAVRQHQHDVALVVEFVRDFSERQSNLFLLAASFLVRYQPPELQPLLDEDVAEACGALAATFETASHGVIYEHRAASLPAERLAAGLRSALEAGGNRDGAFERDAAIVLKRIQDGVTSIRSNEPATRAFLEMLNRVIGRDAEEREPSVPASRLIVP